MANTTAYAEILAGVDPALITSANEIAALPVTRKSELMALQKKNRPFGGFADGPKNADAFNDFSSEGPCGLNFIYLEEENLIPKEAEATGTMQVLCPRENGFKFTRQSNLFPREQPNKSRRKDR